MADLQAARKVRVIIPALNEEKAIAAVLRAVPAWVAETIVVDNGSTDGTARVARELGATVITEPRRGYGSACLRGIAALPRDTEVTVFLDGDYSDFPEEMGALVEPILEGRADLVIGSRVLGAMAASAGAAERNESRKAATQRGSDPKEGVDGGAGPEAGSKRAPHHESGALLPVARFGNWLSTALVKWGWGFSYTDLGPFRAIRHEALLRLAMRDPDFGWTIEMQVKALARGLSVMEIPVSYRKRIGKSKISGTVLGSFRAGKKILSVIAREWLQSRRR